MKRCPQCNRVETDEALKFCRVDGTTLVSDSSAIGSATGTAQLTGDPSEVHTSILPHKTDAGISRATGPTTTLPPPAPATTGALAKPKSKRWIVIAIIVTALFAGMTAIIVNSYLSRRASAPIDSIAVLPFENKSNDSEAEYLSDGLAESLIYRLSQLPNLKVSPTSSVIRYKGKGGDLNTIANDLGVRAVMTGRLVKRGDNLTISLELIDVANKRLLWGEQFERNMSDLLATQREIASTIADKLQLRLSGSGEKGVTKRYTENNEAYQNYLRGRHYWNKRTKEGMEQGIVYFQKAIDLDPKFALAYVGIADSYFVMPSYAYLDPREALPKAIAASRRALEIDSELAEAHSTYGSVLTYEHRWAEAEQALKRALELNPNSAEIHYRYAMEYLGPVGRIDEAIAEIKRALELEPLSLPIGANLAGMLIYGRRNEAALEQALKVNALEPGHPTASYWLGWVYVANGKYAAAIDLCNRVLPAQPENQDLLQIKGFAHAKAGRPAETELILAKFAEIEKKQYVVPYRVATLYAVLGKKDKAFAELERSYEARDWDFNRLKVDPFVDVLRDDPRFADLLKKLNLPK